MINDICPHIFNNEYRNIKPKKDDIALIYNNEKILLRQENDYIAYPTIEEIKEDNIKYTFLFTIDSKNYFLAENVDISKLKEYSLHSNFILRKTKPTYLSFAGITGYQLNTWYNNTKYCGKCGSKMYHSETSRSMVCSNCKDTRYPFLAPAVIVGIINKDKLLVTKYNRSKYKNYALVAGYAEIGENIEDTVRREVMEEVGLEVKNITYYKSQPWSFSCSLLFGFFCELDGSDQIKLDEDELSMAKWVTREELDNSPDLISLTAEMIQMFKDNRVKFR